jgi:hypothetical protein
LQGIPATHQKHFFTRHSFQNFSILNQSDMRKFLLLCMLGMFVLSQAQVKLEQFKNMKPRNIGPAGMSGRVTAIDALYTNPDIIFVGAASGGVWKTDNGGATWKALFDEQPLINIGSLKVQQTNPSVIWVGTGEGNPRNSLNLGEGIFKTLDGGKTWKRMGLEKTRNIHRILIDPTNANTVYVQPLVILMAFTLIVAYTKQPMVAKPGSVFYIRMIPVVVPS